MNGLYAQNIFFFFFSSCSSWYSEWHPYNIQLLPRVCSCPIMDAAIATNVASFIAYKCATFQSSALHFWQIKNSSVIRRCLTTPRDNSSSLLSPAKVCTWHLVVGFQIKKVYTLQRWTTQLRESAGNCT